MARSQLAPPFSAPPVTAYDPYIDLGRLLSRLDQNILRADGDKWRRLVADEFQRLQARFDVMAARSLLSRVEQDASAIKAASRRQEVQGELSRRRVLVERLQERLDDLDEEARAAAAVEEDNDGEGNDGEGNDDDVDGDDAAANGTGEAIGGSSSSSGSNSSSTAATDDVLAHVIRTPSESLDSRSVSDVNAGNGSEPAEAPDARAVTAETAEADPQPDAEGAGGRTAVTHGKKKKKKKVRIAQTETSAAQRTPEPQSTVTKTVTETATAAATATATTAAPLATMRARRGGRLRSSSSPDADRGLSTSAQAAEGQQQKQKQKLEQPTTSSLRKELLSSTTAGGGEADGVAVEEVLLDHHRREQEVLSEDILRLAKALKERSLATSRLLEDDKNVVDRVGEGLHTTGDHLSAASRSMAVLSRLTEGKGWWGRMLLFAMVYGLMLVLVLMFLFLPKLRL